MELKQFSNTIFRFGYFCCQFVCTLPICTQSHTLATCNPLTIAVGHQFHLYHSYIFIMYTNTWLPIYNSTFFVLFLFPFVTVVKRNEKERNAIISVLCWPFVWRGHRNALNFISPCADVWAIKVALFAFIDWNTANKILKNTVSIDFICSFTLCENRLKMGRKGQNCFNSVDGFWLRIDWQNHSILFDISIFEWIERYSTRMRVLCSKYACVWLLAMIYHHKPKLLCSPINQVRYANEANKNKSQLIKPAITFHRYKSLQSAKS